MDESMLGLAGNEMCYVFCSVKGTSKRSGRLLKTSARARERDIGSTFVWIRS